jgi:hypothetical protein
VIDLPVVHDIQASESEALTLDGLAHPDSGRGVTDTACAKTCAGSQWVDDYLAILKSLRLDSEVEAVKLEEVFRFGDGRRVVSAEAYKLPMVLCGRPMKVLVCVIPDSRLTLLLGRDFTRTTTLISS